MPKIIINSSVKSNTDEEILIKEKAILKDNIITYKKHGINVSINIKNNNVLLLRENDEMKITLNFKKNEKTISFYEIKTLNLKIEIKVITKKLIIDNKKVSITYDLYMNDEFSDSFNYDLEWSDL